MAQISQYNNRFEWGSVNPFCPTTLRMHFLKYALSHIITIRTRSADIVEIGMGGGGGDDVPGL